MGKRLIIHGANFSGVTFGNYVLTAPNGEVALDTNNDTAVITVTSSRVRTVEGSAQPAEFCPLEISQSPQGITAALNQVTGTTTAQLQLAWDGSTELTDEPLVLTQTGGKTLTITVSTEVEQQQQETVTTYGDYAFSASELSLSIEPGSSATVQVTSSRVPSVNGVAQSREFCPFTAAAQGGATCSLGTQSGLTQPLTIALPANATGSCIVVLTQNGSDNQITINISAVVWEYHIEVEDRTVDSGRLALGQSKSIHVTSYKTKDGGATKVFAPFAVQRGTESPVDVNSNLQAGEITATATITMGSTIDSLGKNTTWTVINSGQSASINIFGTPNWVAGYYGSSEEWIPMAASGATNLQKMYASFNPMLAAPTDKSILDFTIDISSTHYIRVVASSHRSSNLNDYIVTSLYDYLRETWNSSGSYANWAINVGRGTTYSTSNQSLDHVDDSNVLTEAQIKEINDNLVITQVQSE